MSPRVFAVLGGVLIGGAAVNEITNFPVRLSTMAVMAIVAVGGLCLAAFLVLAQGESIWGVPGPLVEQEEDGQAQAPEAQHEAGVEPGLAREREGQPDHQGERPDDAEPASRGKHGRG